MNSELSFASVLASTDTLAAFLVQPDGWARGEREGYGGPCDVTSLSLSLSYSIEWKRVEKEKTGIDKNKPLHKKSTTPRPP